MALNQKINEYLPFKNIWVYPAMGDEGLSLGSAIAYGVELGEFTNRRIKNVFFGKKHSENDIQKDIKIQITKPNDLNTHSFCDFRQSSKA